jgi:DNA-binding NtrC family response regulator
MARIWIPDDDNLLLTVIGRSLRRAGHSVVSCSSPEFALVRPGQIRKCENVLIVDLTSDEKQELAVMLKIRLPRLKVLFIAERFVHIAEQQAFGLVRAIAPDERSILRKPFTGNELLAKVDELLASRMDRRAAGAA